MIVKIVKGYEGNVFIQDYQGTATFTVVRMEESEKLTLSKKDFKIRKTHLVGAAEGIPPKVEFPTFS